LSLIIVSVRNLVKKIFSKDFTYHTLCPNQPTEATLDITLPDNITDSPKGLKTHCTRPA
jgi:hypothetical protein